MARLFFSDRIACETYSKLLEYLSVDLAEHHGRMYLTSVKLRKLVKSLAAVFVLIAQH